MKVTTKVVNGWLAKSYIDQEKMVRLL